SLLYRPRRDRPPFPPRRSSDLLSDGAPYRLPGATGDDDPTDAGSTLWATAGPAPVTTSARAEAPATPARTDRRRSRALVLRRVSARPVTGVLPPLCGPSTGPEFWHNNGLSFPGNNSLRES